MGSTQRNGSPGVGVGNPELGSPEVGRGPLGKLRNQRKGQHRTGCQQISQCLGSPCPCPFLFKICPSLLHHTLFTPPWLPSTGWAKQWLLCPHTSVDPIVSSTLAHLSTEPSHSSTIQTPPASHRTSRRGSVKGGKPACPRVGLSEGRRPQVSVRGWVA